METGILSGAEKLNQDGMKDLKAGPKNTPFFFKLFS